MPQNVSMAPQTHQGTLQNGTASVTGVVRDSSGAVLPGVTVRLFGPAGQAASTVTGHDGTYALSAPDARCAPCGSPMAAR
jgi:hypothetical protein